jgi:hypothetical protein
VSHYLQRSTQRQAEQHRRKVCERKRRYRSHWGAAEAIKSLRDETLVAYECEHCAGWHIGHLPEPVAP